MRMLEVGKLPAAQKLQAGEKCYCLVAKKLTCNTLSHQTSQLLTTKVSTVWFCRKISRARNSGVGYLSPYSRPKFIDVTLKYLPKFAAQIHTNEKCVAQIRGPHS